MKVLHFYLGNIATITLINIKLQFSIKSGLVEVDGRINKSANTLNHRAGVRVYMYIMGLIGQSDSRT